MATGRASIVALVLLLASPIVSSCGGTTGNPPLDDAIRACDTARGLRGAVSDGPILGGDDAAALRDVTWYSSLAYEGNPQAFGSLYSLLRHFTRAAVTGGDIATAALDAADKECERVGAR